MAISTNKVMLHIFRSPASPVLDSGLSNATFEDTPKVDKHYENDQEMILSAQTATAVLTDVEAPESKALVPFPSVSGEALAMVPVNQKPKRSEVSQRRTRRPFSVSEVEALVEAVEILGTGRCAYNTEASPFI